MMSKHRLLADRAPWKTSQGRRIRKLFHGFIAKLDAEDAIHQAAALRAAELTVAAERARARLLASECDTTAAEESVVRLENTARRAADDLIPLIPQPVKWWEQQDEEADGDKATS